MRSSDRPFVVVGGGIGGLSCALALAQAGFPVCVLEQAAQFSEVGAGIQLGPNFMRALDQLGLKQQVLSEAWLPGNLVVRDAIDGALLSSIPLGEGFHARFGQPYALTHRADLLATLVAACHAEPSIELLTGRRVEHLTDAGDEVTVTLADGEVLVALGVVGADGLWSRVRQDVLGDGPPSPYGHIAYRGVLAGDALPAELWSADMNVWLGPRTHFVHYPLRRGTLYNLVAVFHSDRHEEGYDQAGNADELWRHFGNAHPSVRALLEKIDTWRYWVVYDREPTRGWSKGRVTLLGDAAHPMLQYLAQGAAMAVEDSVCLARQLRSARSDVAGAFARYEDTRVLRTARVQIMARVYGDVFHAANVARELRNEWLAGRTSEQGWEGMAWLYDHGMMEGAGAAG